MISWDFAFSKSFILVSLLYSTSWIFFCYSLICSLILFSKLLLCYSFYYLISYSCLYCKCCNFSSFYFISFMLSSLWFMYCWSFCYIADSSFLSCWLFLSTMLVLSITNASIYVFCSLVSSSNILIVDYLSEISLFNFPIWISF